MMNLFGLARQKRSRDVDGSPEAPAVRIISSTPREGGPRPTVPVPDLVPGSRAKQPWRKPPASNNSSVRGKSRAATTDADDDDEYADAIDSDDDHGARRDEQANATEAVSTSSKSSSWPS